MALSSGLGGSASQQEASSTFAVTGKERKVRAVCLLISDVPCVSSSHNSWARTGHVIPSNFERAENLTSADARTLVSQLQFITTSVSWVILSSFISLQMRRLRLKKSKVTRPRALNIARILIRLSLDITDLLFTLVHLCNKLLSAQPPAL